MIHQIDSICPLCSSVNLMGSVDMAGQDVKYICPQCGARHYGKPPHVKLRGYTCGECGITSKSKLWKKTPLDSDERIMGPMQSCGKCNAKLKDGKIAFIEIEDGTTGESGRTGRLFFITPDKEFLESLNGQMATYIEKSVLEKMMKENDETERENQT